MCALYQMWGFIDDIFATSYELTTKVCIHLHSPDLDLEDSTKRKAATFLNKKKTRK